MAWAFDVTSNIPRITQSGTDANLDGILTAINAMGTVARSTAYTVSQMIKPPTPTGFWYRCSTAGTTSGTAPAYGTTLGGTTTDGTAVFTAFRAPEARWQGTGYLYNMPDVRVNITGTVTNANPQVTSFICWDLLLSASGSNFTSGTWASDGVTPLYDGVHFTGVRESTNASDNSSGSFQLQLGQFTFIGGEVQVCGAIGLAAGTTPRSYYTRWRSVKTWSGVTTTRVRAYSVNAIFRQCEFYAIAYDLFQMPSEFSVKGRKAEYVAQYAGQAYGGVDAYFKASALENVDGSYDFDNYGGGYVELFNCAKGATLNVTSQLPSTKHCVPLYQDVIITAKNTSGVAVQDVRFTATDAPTNPPTITITTAGSLKTWDFRTALAYQATTNASGIANTSPILKIWYYQTSLKSDLRFPASTATYQGRAYNYKTTDISIVLGSNSAQSVSAGMVGLDTSTTVTEAVAGAITGISLVPSGATGGTITISSNKSYQDIWNYYRYWISQFANRASTDTWTCLGGTLNTQNWNIVVNSGVTVTSSTNITKLQTLGTITNNGSITAIYQDSTGTSAILNWSNLTNTSLFLANGSGTQVDYQNNLTGTYVNYLPANSTGTWNWIAERYSYTRNTGSFLPVTGGNFSATPSWVSDIYITASKATVAAYTSISNLDQLYDYEAYWRTLNAGINSPLITRNGSQLNFGAITIVLDATASSVFSYNAGTTTLTVKSTALVAGSKFDNIKANTFTLLNGAAINCVYTNSIGTSTVLELNTPSAGYSLCIFKADGTTKYFTSNVAVGSYYVYFTPSEAGTYYLGAENYGQKRTADTLVLSGGQVWYNITDGEDVGITANFATANAWTDLSGDDTKLYDGIAIYRLTETGIKLGQIVTRDGTSLDFTPYNVIVNDQATSKVSVSGGTLTLKALTINSTTKYDRLVTSLTKTIVPADNELINVTIQDANGDSKLTIQGGSGTYQIWKLTNSTPNTDFQTGTLLTTTTNLNFRFIGIDGYKLFVYDTSTLYGSSCSMSKGTYIVPLFFGSQVQLAQSQEVTQINEKVDALLVKEDIVLGDLTIINNGVKKSSILVPHTQNL